MPSLETWHSWYRLALNNDFQVPQLRPNLTVCCEENDSTFPLCEELLYGAGEAVSSVDHESGRLEAPLQIAPNRLHHNYRARHGAGFTQHFTDFDARLRSWVRARVLQSKSSHPRWYRVIVDVRCIDRIK